MRFRHILDYFCGYSISPLFDCKDLLNLKILTQFWFLTVSVIFDGRLHEFSSESDIGLLLAKYLRRLSSDKYIILLKRSSAMSVGLPWLNRVDNVIGSYSMSHIHGSLKLIFGLDGPINDLGSQSIFQVIKYLVGHSMVGLVKPCLDLLKGQLLIFKFDE